MWRLWFNLLERSMELPGRIFHRCRGVPHAQCCCELACFSKVTASLLTYLPFLSFFFPHIPLRHPCSQDHTGSYHTDALFAVRIHRSPRSLALEALPVHLRYVLSFRAVSRSMHTNMHARNQCLAALPVLRG